MSLDQHQQALLVTLVEAARRGAALRPDFSYTEQPPGSIPRLAHAGLRDPLAISKADIEALSLAGLLSHQSFVAGTGSIHLADAAFEVYEQHQSQSPSVVESIERDTLTYLNSQEFRGRYPDASVAWTSAATLLRSPEVKTQLTTIGHSCREAMQQFAAAVSGAPTGSASDPGRANTVARIRGRLNNLNSKCTQAFLDALLAYWGTVSDLAQRQEHGGQKEGDELTVKDARRLVYQTANVMFEIASVLGDGADKT